VLLLDDVMCVVCSSSTSTLETSTSSKQSARLECTFVHSLITTAADTLSFRGSFSTRNCTVLSALAELHSLRAEVAMPMHAAKS
jgi:hypothetical protein